MLATGGADMAIKVWDARTGDQKKTITGFKKEVTAVKFVATGDEMLTSGGDPHVSMRDTNGGNKGAFSGVSGFIYAARASADGKAFAAGGQDSHVRVLECPETTDRHLRTTPRRRSPKANVQAAK